MAKGIRYSDEFKQQAVNQIVKHGYDLAEVSIRLGISIKTLYKWKQEFSKPTKAREAESDLQAEVARLIETRAKAGATGEGYIKGGRSVLCKRVKERYAFIKARSHAYPIRLLCSALAVHASGYYAGLKFPESLRTKEDQHLLRHIKQFWLESGGHYGYRNIHLDLQQANIACGRDRVLRLMQQERLKAQRGYRKPRGY